MEEEEPTRRSPLWIAAGLFLALIILISVLPYYYIKDDPEPKKRATYEDIIPYPIQPDLDTINKIQRHEDIYRFITPDDPFVKNTATKIATFACDSNKLCQAKAVYYFVQDNFIYVSESDEFFQTFEQSLSARGGDCDDATILLANMYMAIGIPVQVIFIKGHVFLEVYIKDAPKGYLNDEGWIYVDGTCDSCGFGEIPKKNIDAPKYYVRV